MKHVALCVFGLLLFSKGLFAQLYESPELRLKLQTADSIVLISHKITHDYAVIEDKPGSKNLAPYFLIKGRINPKIIIERLLLNKDAKDELLQILTREVTTKKLTFAKCDQPQHSILIYKNNKLSYIDICFGCRRIHTSKDILFDEFDFDEKKWNDLISLYKSLGLNYVFKLYDL